MCELCCGNDEQIIDVLFNSVPTVACTTCITAISMFAKEPGDILVGFFTDHVYTRTRTKD